MVLRNQIHFEVWFQNRRSKERRMKQLRYGGLRPTRRNRGSGARDELSVTQNDIYSHETANDGFFSQPPMSFFCDGYTGTADGRALSTTVLSHPSFIIPSEGTHRIRLDTSTSENNFLEDGLRPPHSSPNMPLAAQVDAARISMDGVGDGRTMNGHCCDQTDSCNGTENVKLKSCKRLDNLSWEEYFMGLAHLSAQRSKDPVTQVGAVVVNDDNKIIGIGYNGMPLGCSDDKLPWGKGSSNFLENKNTFVCHAEMNAILNCNGQSTKGAKIYTVLFPCNECAKIIIQAGIKEVVFQKNKPAKLEEIAARRLFAIAGIAHRRFTSDCKITINLSENVEDDCKIDV